MRGENVMKRILLLMGIVPILMSLASCGKKENVTVPRKFADYDFSVDTDTLPLGVECIIK